MGKKARGRLREKIMGNQAGLRDIRITNEPTDVVENRKSLDRNDHLHHSVRHLMIISGFFFVVQEMDVSM